MLQGTPGGIKVFVARVYDSMALEFNTGLATSYSMVLVVLSVITLIFYIRITRFSERYATITGKGYRVKVIDIGPWKYVTFLAVLFYFSGRNRHSVYRAYCGFDDPLLRLQYFHAVSLQCRTDQLLYSDEASEFH